MKGYIEISIKGSLGNVELSPESFDIKAIKEVLEQAENLLFPNEKRDRPVVSYQMLEGSVINRFQTGLQTIIGFTAILAQIEATGNIDFLESASAKAIESFQEMAYQKDFSITINTSVSSSPFLVIDRSTAFVRSESYWADAEFYFYGKITNAGGKDRANIHLVTEELGTLIIKTPQEVLERLEENILYKPYGIRATGKQQVETAEIDKSSLRYLELIEFSPRYDEEYLRGLRESARSWLDGLDTEQFLREIRER